MNRSEVLRAELCGSALRGHSLNQRRLKSTFEGEDKMLGLAGKEARVRRREERRADEHVIYEAEKTSRIFSSVIAALSGQDVSTSWEVLSKEIQYLRRRLALEIIVTSEGYVLGRNGRTPRV